MKRRFSRQELFAIRNDIPINTVIEKIIPSRFSEGYFRFVCPICNEYRTSTDPKTNLARCYRCELNYNTIEIVKYSKGLNFVEAVYYLKRHYQSFLQKGENRQILDKHERNSSQLKRSITANKEISSIGSILRSMSQEMEKAYKPDDSPIKPNLTTNPHLFKLRQENIIQRITALEKQVRIIETELKNLITLPKSSK